MASLGESMADNNINNATESVERLRALLHEFDRTICDEDTNENARQLTAHQIAIASSQANVTDLIPNAQKLNVVFLGSLQPYTLPYITCSAFAQKNEFFAALNASWIHLSDVGTPRRLLLKKALYFRGTSMHPIDFGGDPVVIHYLYNKNRNLDQQVNAQRN